MTALEKKAAELRADLAHLETLRERTSESLAHVEATLALLRAPNGFQRRWMFKRGELRRLILAVEREAGDRQSAREIARAIIARRGWNADDRHLENLLAMKVRNARRNVTTESAYSKGMDKVLDSPRETVAEKQQRLKSETAELRRQFGDLMPPGAANTPSKSG